MVSGWDSKYLEILREFGYDRKKDLDSAIILNSILKDTKPLKKIRNSIDSKTVFVIGSGPSLSDTIPFLKKFKNTTKIVADSALKPLIENDINPDIVVTDLDGDEKSLKKIGDTDTVFVVHAHGDNIARLQFVENFRNYIGTTQTKPFGKIKNFGGFTDGDRAVFLASYFKAKKIILCGMDFGKKIGKFSNTRVSDREIKMKKLKKAGSLLVWLSKKSRSELFTTSTPIEGFKRVRLQELDIIIT